MDKNKSIDGLVTRRSKKTTNTNKIARSPKTSIKQAKKPTAKSVKKSSVPTRIKSKAPEVTDVTPEPENTLSEEKPTTEDFLQPVEAFNFDQETGELKASEELSKKEMKKMKKEAKKLKKAKKTPSKKRKIITSILLVIVLLLIGGAIWFIVWGNDIIAKITGGQGNILDLLTFVEETYEPLKTDENGRTNILAFGTSGYNMEGDEGNGKHDGAQLTDSIMVISLNQETGDLAMLSLPRDLKASPTCTATGKINEVYWCNNMNGEDEAAGATALMNEVSSILGIDFQYYAHLNWGSLISIVDILGGIQVTLDEDIHDYYYTGAVYDAGVEYTIDGAQAMGLARARHGTTSGDFSRGASQQKILIGIKNKVLEKDLSITDMISLASTLGDNLRTNFTIEEMKSLAHLTSNFDFDSMRQISLIEPKRLMTTGMINNISYVLPSGGAGYYTAIQDYISTMLSNDPRTYEESTILVLNGTNEVGVATAEKNKLETEGYSYVYADDAPEGEYTNNYTLYALTNKPGTKRLLEEYYGLTADKLEDLPAGISTDYDFVIIIGGSFEED